MITGRRLKRIIAAAAGLAAVLGGLGLGPQPARAAGLFTVNSQLDSVDVAPGDGACANIDGLCSLRAAVMEANALAGADLVILPSGTYTLTIPTGPGNHDASDDLEVTDDLTLQGQGGPIIGVAAALADGAFELESNRLEISGVTIRGSGPSGSFGAVMNLCGHLVIINSVVRDFTGTNLGGGVFQQSTFACQTPPSTRLVDTLLLDNSSVRGGGVYLRGGTLELVNTTLQGNAASEDGGGLYIEAGTVSLDHSRLISNTADEDGGGFYLESGALTVLDSQALTNTAGSAGGGGGFNLAGSLWLTRTLVSGNQAPSGAGLYSSSALTLTQSTVSDNVSTHNGSGLLVGAGATRIERSTISGNRSPFNGGGFYVGTGTLTLLNSTVSHNRSGLAGGGLFIATAGTAHLYSVTIAGNQADDDGDGLGGGVAISGTLDIRNTLIANNTNGDNPLVFPQPPDDCRGTLTSFGNNLIERTTGCTIASPDASNVLGQDPALGALLPHNDAPATHALLPGSPAIDAGNPAYCRGPGGLILTTDQRGVPRHTDANQDGLAYCDIGAFEVGWQLWLPLLVR